MSAESGSCSGQTQTLEDRQSTYDARLRDALTIIINSEILPPRLFRYGGHDDTIMCLTENKLTRTGISHMQKYIPIVQETALDKLSGTLLPGFIDEARARQAEATSKSQSGDDTEVEEEDMVRTLEMTLAALQVLKEHVCPGEDSEWFGCGPKEDVPDTVTDEVVAGSQLAGVDSMDWSAETRDTEWTLMRRMELSASFAPAIIAGKVATSTDKETLTRWQSQMNHHVDRYKTRMGVGGTRGGGTTLNIPSDRRGFGQREEEPTWDTSKAKYVDLIEKTNYRLKTIAKRKDQDGIPFTKDRCYNSNEAVKQNDYMRKRWWDEQLRSGQVSLSEELPQYELNGDIRPEE